jgi:predicted enzyme related to lactoylglutathione lyase
MVRDVPASIRFYQSIGFTLRGQDVPNDSKYAVITRDGVELHLQWHDAQEWTYPNDRPAYRFLVRDVDGLFSQFVDGLAKPDVKPPFDSPWGTREFHLRDPDLNCLQFYHPLRQ